MTDDYEFTDEEIEKVRVSGLVIQGLARDVLSYFSERYSFAPRSYISDIVIFYYYNLKNNNINLDDNSIKEFVYNKRVDELESHGYSKEQAETLAKLLYSE